MSIFWALFEASKANGMNNEKIFTNEKYAPTKVIVLSIRTPW